MKNKLIRKILAFLIILSITVNLMGSYIPLLAYTNDIDESLFIEENDQEESYEEIILNEDYYNDTSYILYEDETKRTAYSKTYYKSDGSYEINYYPSQVHYLDENNIYQEIDPTLKENGINYDSDSINYKTKLPKKINSNKKIKLIYKNSHIEITIPNINKVEGKPYELSSYEKELKSEKILYEDVFTNVDLEYIVNNGSLKENIILKEYIKDFSFSYIMKLNNCNLIEDVDGYINIYNSEEKLIYQIDPYYMVDTNNNISFEIETKIEQINNREYQITIIPKDEYLQTAAYPVIIDPTIKYEQNSIANKLTMRQILNNAYIATNPLNLYISKYYNSVTGEDLSKSVILDLNIESLTKNVKYTGAFLYLFGTSGMDEYLVGLEKINNNIPFSSINGQTELSTSFVEFQSSEQIKLDNTSSYVNAYYYNITNLINDNINEEHIQLLLTPKYYEGNYEAMIYNVTSTQTTRPMLVFTYISMDGLSEEWTSQKEEISSGHSVYITDYTGNLTVERTDYQTKAEKNSFDITFYYNTSKHTQNIGYGYGWRNLYNERIQPYNTIQNARSIIDDNINQDQDIENGSGNVEYYIKTDGTSNENAYKKLDEPLAGKIYTNKGICYQN